MTHELSTAAGAPQPAPTPAPSTKTARAGEVLRLVRSGQATTTGEVAAALGVARSTAAERVDLLLAHDLLRMTDGLPVARRGRRPSRLAFNPRSGIVIAVQIGMSGSRLAITDLEGEPVWHDTVHEDIAQGPDVVLSRLVTVLDQALDELGESHGRIRGIGVGVPGKVELATTRSTALRERQWSDATVATTFGSAFGAPVNVDQDVNLLALGEHQSSWPAARNLIVVKAGTVIGCGIIVDGSVARGSGGLAGEIGHSSVAGSDVECACGNAGCLNAVASGAALAEQLGRRGLEASTARDVARLAKEGSLEARQAIRRAGQEIGTVLAGAINLLNPEIVAVWGYLVDAGDQLLAGINEAVHRHAVPVSAQAVRIERARLGEDAGVRGAALTVIEDALRPESIDQLVARPA